MEFLWMMTTDDPNSPFALWVPIPGTNSPEYNPGPISVTTYYRRCSRRAGCLDYTGETNIVAKEAICCDNITDGGEIAADQLACVPPFDPAVFTNVISPSGGSNIIEYQWVVSTTGTPFSASNPDWNPINGANAESYDPGPVSQTTYFIRLSRRHGCLGFDGVSNMVTVTISNDMDGNADIKEVTCFGGMDGAIDLTVTGGGGPYQFSWLPDQGNVEDPQSVGAGNYSVTVSDANGCTFTTLVTVEDGDQLILTTNIADESCLGANNGNATVSNVTGGVPDYTYAWSDPTLPATPSATGFAPGTYAVTVTDSQGCTGSNSFTIDAGPMLVVTAAAIDVSCFGGNDGSATVASVSGGVPSYEYAWSDTAQQTTATAAGLMAGIFSVTVTDVQGCTGVASATVNDGDQLVLSTSHTDAVCNYSADGSATVTVVGGQAPYAYLWDDPAGQTSSTANGLSAGTFSVTVTNADGCTSQTSVTIGAPMETQISVSGQNLSCFESNDGSVSVAVLNGDPADFTYSWSHGPLTAQSGNLPVGSYTVTVSDANGCIVSGSTSIAQPLPLILTMTADSASCADASNGTASVSVSGGTLFPNGDYQYVWSAAGNPQVQVLDDVSPGNYTVTVTDANGCSATGTAEIGAPTPIQIGISLSNVSCFGENDGSMSAQVSGGVSPYSLNWSLANSTGNTISDLSPGVYQISVTDGNGCLEIASASITQPDLLAASIQKTDVICLENTDGTAQAVVIGGTAPYAFSWSNGQTTAGLTGLGVGNFELTVTDANGCTATASTSIVSTSNLSLSLTATAADCFNSNDGAIASLVNGGTAPVTYLWNTGATATSLSGLVVGQYSLTITDGNGCTATSTAFVTSPPELVATAVVTTPISTFGGNNGAVSIFTAGGVSPYDYEWANGSSQGTLTNLAAGTYQVTVTDGNGCTDAAAVTLPNPSKIGDFVWKDLDQDGVQDAGEPGMAGVTVHLIGATLSGTQVNIAAMSGANGEFAFDGLSPGNYQVKVDLPAIHVFSPANIGSDLSDSDILSDSLTEVFFLAASTFASHWDIGLIELDEKINIGDFVFQDADHNGIQGINEQGIQNITVRLYEMPSNTLVASTTTNLLGKYLFTNVMPGIYQVEFALGSLQNGYVYAPKDQGGNDQLDSDPDPATGRTASFQVSAYTVDNLTIDAGIFKECDNVTDGGAIGFSEQLCGIGSDPDEIVNLTLPSGGFGTLEYLWLSSTVPVYNGAGDPNWLPVPNSNTPSYDPGPLSSSTYFIRCSRRSGCVDYPAESNIVSKTITPNPLTQIIDEPGTLCPNEGGRFEAAIAGGGATYAWQFGADATPASAMTRVVNNVSWSTPGSKSVSLTVTRFGCAFTITTSVEVQVCGNPLIINFDEFDVSMELDQAHLTWSVTGDVSSAVFYVQRSRDGENFENLQLVPGTSAPVGGAYSYLDPSVKMGETFYRIKFRQDEGSVHEGFSSVVSIDHKPKGVLTAAVYPNPTNGPVNVQLVKKAGDPVIVKVWDGMGRVVQQLTIPSGEESCMLDLSHCESGIYWVFVHRNGMPEEITKVFKSE